MARELLTCARKECKEPAIGDQPRLCAEHALAFFALLGSVTQKRLEQESSDAKGHADG